MAEYGIINVYQFPIYGSLIQLNPKPIGQDDEPVAPISFFDLPNPPQDILDGNFTNIPLNYNFNTGWCMVQVDAPQAVHDWIVDVLDPTHGVDGKSKAQNTLDALGLTFKRKDLQ